MISLSSRFVKFIQTSGVVLGSMYASRFWIGLQEDAKDNPPTLCLPGACCTDLEPIGAAPCGMVMAHSPGEGLWNHEQVYCLLLW